MGRVVALDDEVAEVEVAPGVVMTFLKRAVTARGGTTPATSSGVVDDEWDIPSQTGDDQAGDSVSRPADEHPHGVADEHPHGVADEQAHGVTDEHADHQQSTDSSASQDGVVAEDDDHPGDDSPGEAGSGDQNDRLS